MPTPGQGSRQPQPRLTTWLEWYRFARSHLELGHDEAVEYANARTVEEGNRKLLRARRKAA